MAANTKTVTAMGSHPGMDMANVVDALHDTNSMDVSEIAPVLGKWQGSPHLGQLYWRTAKARVIKMETTLFSWF